MIDLNHIPPDPLFQIKIELTLPFSFSIFLRFYRGQKVLKDVNEFYIYLMDRLVRLHDGIHNLKLIGINLRYIFIQPQVYIHST